MINTNDYLDGFMCQFWGPSWDSHPVMPYVRGTLEKAVEPLIDRIAELMNRCRAAGIDVSDLED